MPLIIGLPSGTPHFRDGVDHLGHATCNPCLPFPEGHPTIGRRLRERAADLGYETVAEMRAMHPHGGTYPHVRSAEEIATGLSPVDVAQRYGYPDPEEMRRCEVAGREADEESDAFARAAGGTGGFVLEREARLSVLEAAERFWGKVTPERPVDEVHSEAELRPVRDYAARAAEKIRAEPYRGQWFSTAPEAGKLYVAPLGGGEFVDVGRMASDGVTFALPPGSGEPVRHEMVRAEQWRTDLSAGFAGAAECACGLVHERSAADGGPKAARAAIELHIGEWAENRLTASLRERLKATSAAWSRLQSELDQVRAEEAAKREALEERQAEVRRSLRQQLGSLGALVTQRTGERNEFRAEAARLRARVSEAWTRLGGLAGTDAELIHEQVAVVRERLRGPQEAAGAEPAEAVPGGGSVDPAQVERARVDAAERAAVMAAVAGAERAGNTQLAEHLRSSLGPVAGRQDSRLAGLQRAVEDACARLATVPVDVVARVRQELAEALRVSQDAGGGGEQVADAEDRLRALRDVVLDVCVEELSPSGANAEEWFAAAEAARERLRAACGEPEAGCGVCS